MGAIVNGLTLHGFRAYGATFLIFSDYMKASIRLAALMGIPSIFVFTHDSIGLGEDGPTHQPIEQLAALRATPNVDVVRPAGRQRDGAGVALRARRRRSRPTVMALSRQGLPVLEPRRGPARRDRARRVRAARVLQGRGARPDPDRDRAPRCTSAPRPPTCSRRTGSPRASCPRRASTASPSRTRPTATRCCRRRAARAYLGRGRRHARLGPLGRRRGPRGRDDRLRRVGAAAGPLRALRLHAGGNCRRTAGRWRRDERPAVAGQRAPGRAHRGGHERLARPDPAQPDRVRRARAARRGGLAARRHLEPGDLREGDPRLGRLRRRASSQLAEEGLSAKEIYERIAVKDVQLAADVLRPSGTRPAATTASSRSRSRPISRTTPRHARARRATSGSASTGPT